MSRAMPEDQAKALHVLVSEALAQGREEGRAEMRRERDEAVKVLFLIKSHVAKAAWLDHVSPFLVKLERFK